PAPGAVPLVAIHGISRGARAQAEAFAARATATGRPVIAPDFDTRRWPRFQQVVREGRADLALIGLLDELRLEGIVQAPRVDLAGYSAGAQFAHRFAMLHPRHVGRLTLLAAGWYTHPDTRPFPYGLAPADAAQAGTAEASLPGGDWGGIMQARLGEYLARPITVAVGAGDNVVDRHTRTGPALERQQGATRLDRARRYVEVLGAEAASRGLPSPRLAVLPGAGHDFGACLRAGLVPLILPAAGQAPAGSLPATATHPVTDR
ncbi:MAG: hypothetical protein AAFZ09_04640, partial [Pseudomonadota bacterium]